MDVEGDIQKGIDAAKMYLSDTQPSPDIEMATKISKQSSSIQSQDISKTIQTSTTTLNGNAPKAYPPKKLDPKKEYIKRFTSYFSQWKNAKILIATAMCWFLLDIGFYGTNLNTSIVLSAIGYADNSTPFNHVWTEAIGALIIACAGNVPGYFFTVFFVDKWGRKPIQFMGFAVLFICFTILSAAYKKLKNEAIPVFIVVYSIAQFFFNFGPNSTTFIIPAEVFPTHVRSTAHGISAASGKLK